MQVIALILHTTGRFLAVSTDMADFLAVVTVSKTSISFARIYLACNTTKACQFKYLLGL
jgi:hypothetical protein